MNTVDGIDVRVSVSLREYISDIRRMSNETARNTRKMSRDVGKVTHDFAALGSTVRSTIGVVGLGLMAKAAIQTTDNMTRLENRIRAVIGDTARLAEFQDRLYDSSQRMGLQLDETLELFQRFSLVREKLQATDYQILQLAETVQQLGIIGGTSSDQLGNVTLQLSQGLANGTLQAQELNSILEGAPMIAAAIEDGLGLASGSLKKMVLDGKILSQDVFEALLSQSDEVAEKFAEMPIDLDRAMNKAGNGIQRVLYGLEQQYGVVNSLALLLSDIADNIAPSARQEMAQLTEELLKYDEFIRTRQRKLEEAGGSDTRLERQIQLLQQKRDAVIDAMDALSASVPLSPGSVSPDGQPGAGIADAPVKAAIKKLQEQIAIAEALTAPDKMAAKLGLGNLSSDNPLHQQLFDLVTLLEDLEAAQDREIAQQQEAADLVNQHADAAYLLEQVKARQAELLPDIIKLVGDETKARELLARAYDSEKEAIENRNKKRTESIRLEEAFGHAAESSFERAIFSGERLDKVLGKLIEDLIRLAIRQAVLKPLGNIVGGFFGGLLPFGKASGGTISRPTLVGERGPEIVTPSRNMTVLNGHDTQRALSGGGAPVINQTNNFDLMPDPTIDAYFDRRLPEIVEATALAVMSKQSRGV